MQRRLTIVLMSLSLVSFLFLPAAAAQSSIQVTDNQATMKFPEWITFSADLKSESEINRVWLEYGVDQLTCGTLVAKAFPEFTPSTRLTVKWTWEMKQTGSQAPGATVWWRWRVATASGQELVTDKQTITWLDNWRAWQKVSGPSITLHWYSGSQAYATELRDAAVQALAALAKQTGLKADGTIDLYIYANSKDLHEAILYEPGWLGGAAFAEHNSVIIAIAPNEIEWGKHTIAHELTHVLVGRYTFNCLSDEPTWLSEGLAMVGEGGPDANAQKQFKAAVADDKLASVRALSGGFAEASDRADLSYSQSYSLVNFLINEYGQDRMMTFLLAQREGTAFDQALKAVYGFDVEGFEDAWRAKIGAKPRASTSRLAATATPTVIPTLVPVPGILTPTSPPTQAPPTATATATAAPTATDTPAPAHGATPTPAARTTPLPTIAVLAGMLVLTALVVAGLSLVRRGKR